jgi:hypothetical protein
MVQQKYVRVSYYLYASFVLLIWSLLQDEFLSYRLGWGLALELVFLFGSLAHQHHYSAHLDCRYLIPWLLKHISILLLIIAWSDNQKKVQFLYGACGLLLAEIQSIYSSMKHAHFDHDTFPGPWISILTLGLAFFVFLASLAAGGYVPAYVSFAWISLYAIIPVLFYYIIQKQTTPTYSHARPTYYLLLAGLLSMSLILAGRRWSKQNTMPWYLIIQPVIGVCIIQVIQFSTE